MAYDLSIKFSGLCMFAPRADGSEMLVLLPATGDTASPHGHAHEHADEHVHEHVAALAFELSAVDSVQSGLQLTTFADADMPGTPMAFLDFGGSHVTFGLSKGSPFSPDLTGKQVEHMSTRHGGKKPAKALLDGDKPPKALAGRVCLAHGKAHGFKETGVTWDYVADGEAARDEDIVRMTNEIEWLIAGAAGDRGRDELVVRFNNAPKLRLRPRGGSLALWIYHIPVGERPLGMNAPKDLAVGEKAPHFETFKRLVKATDTKHPRLRSKDRQAVRAAAARGTSPLTCFVVGGGP